MSLKTATKLYKDAKKRNGNLAKWTDKQIQSTRDKMRKIARKNRGKWTLEFYESLQFINKEGIRRKLPQKTA